MPNEYIIKLIGHRPVYRVVRDSLCGFLDAADDGQDRAGTSAPLLDREDRHRMLSGMPRAALADAPL